MKFFPRDYLLTFYCVPHDTIGCLCICVGPILSSLCFFLWREQNVLLLLNNKFCYFKLTPHQIDHGGTTIETAL
jgi:hypothetical protein